MLNNLYQNIVSLLIPSLLLTGCLFDSGTLWQDSQYEVSWRDTGDNRQVYYKLDSGNKIGRIGAPIVAVGSNDLFLVAKRDDENSQVFYYIDKREDKEHFNGSDIAKGPFTKKEFEALTHELGLPPFEKTFD